MDDLIRQIDQFLEHCERGVRLSPKTVRAYRCDLLQFVQWLIQESRPQNPTRDDLRAYVHHLNDRFAPSTSKRKVASLHAFFSWRLEEGMGDDPFYGLRIRIHEPQRLPRTIPQQDLRKIFSIAGIAESDRPMAEFLAARERAIVELLIETGLRISELCSLDLQDLDIPTHSILVMGKGSRERIAHVENQTTRDALEVYLERRSLLLRRSASRERNALFVNRSGQQATRRG